MVFILGNPVEEYDLKDELVRDELDDARERRARDVPHACRLTFTVARPRKTDSDKKESH